MRHITFQDDVFQEENENRLQIYASVNISDQAWLNRQGLDTSFRLHDVLF